jgi:hypothetical protein
VGGLFHDLVSGDQRSSVDYSEIVPEMVFSPPSPGIRCRRRSGGRSNLTYPSLCPSSDQRLLFASRAVAGVDWILDIAFICKKRGIPRQLEESSAAKEA